MGAQTIVRRQAGYLDSVRRRSGRVDVSAELVWKFLQYGNSMAIVWDRA